MLYPGWINANLKVEWVVLSVPGLARDEEAVQPKTTPLVTYTGGKAVHWSLKLNTWALSSTP